MAKKAGRSLYNAYIIILTLGMVLAFSQNIIVSARYPEYNSDWIFFLPVYITFLNLLLYYLFSRNPQQKKHLFMLGSALRLLAYLVPTFIYIFITRDQNQRLFFVVLIFIYYFSFTFSDSVLKMQQLKK